MITLARQTRFNTYLHEELTYPHVDCFTLQIKKNGNGAFSHQDLIDDKFPLENGDLLSC